MDSRSLPDVVAHGDDDCGAYEFGLDELDMRTPQAIVDVPFFRAGLASPIFSNNVEPQPCIPLHRSLVLLPSSPRLYQNPPTHLGGADAMNADDHTGMAPQNPAPELPESSQSSAATDPWESHKSIIQDLYMTRGMNLNDVIDTMSNRHGFKATKRMYKRRFERWGWHKYQSKRCERDQAAGRDIRIVLGKTCTRKTAKRRIDGALFAQKQTLLRLIESQPVDSLLHGDDDTFLLHNALSSLRQFLHACAESHPRWATTDEFSNLLGYSLAYTHVTLGWNHFKSGELEIGGRLLRKAAIEFEKEFQDDPLDALDVLNIMIARCRNRGEKEVAFACSIISHLAYFTQSKPGLFHLTPILSSLSHILRLQGQRMQQYSLEICSIWTNEIRNLRGSRDLTVLLLLDRIKSYSNPEPDERAIYVRELVSGFESLLQSAKSGTKSDSDVEARLENAILAVQYRSDIYFDNYAQKVENLMDKLRDRYASKSIPVKNWILHDQDVFASCFEYLFDFYADQKDADGMLKVFTAFGVEMEPLADNDNWMNVLYRMESALRRLGMEQETDTLKTRRLQSRLYEELEEEFAADEAQHRNKFTCGTMAAEMSSHGGA